ncbi:GtrA family protein [Arcobacter aquimarinus]|uniref:GtrA family protein n=1 Tax=Arcobacter aquimarinus TaxID=1315211 RepID=UPI003BB06243
MLKNISIRYLFVSVITVLIDYITIFLIYSLLELNYILAICFGLSFAGIFQFFANFHYTFKLKNKNEYKKRAIVYFIAIIIGVFLSTLVVIILENFINSLYLSKTFSLFINFIYGYTVSKYIIFNKNIKFYNNCD